MGRILPSRPVQAPNLKEPDALLDITPGALTAIRTAHHRKHLSDDFGVRLFAGGTLNGPGTIEVGFSEAPLVGDQVCQHRSGVRLFIAAEVQSIAADLVLDIEENRAGTRLVVRCP